MDAEHAAHVERLVAQHDQAVKDMQTYYNDVVRSNLDVIKALKQQLGDASKTAAGASRAAAAAEAAQAAMEGPLATANAKVEALKGAAHGAARDRALLKRTTKQLARATKVLQGRDLQLEALQQQHQALQMRCDALARCAVVAAVYCCTYKQLIVRLTATLLVLVCRQHEAALLESRRLAALQLQTAWGRVAGALGQLQGSLPGGRWEAVRAAVQDALLGGEDRRPQSRP